MEVKIAMENNPIDAGLERLGTPSRFACPECHGVLLLELKEGQRSRSHCPPVTPTLIASRPVVGEGIEEALWNAVRSRKGIC